MCERGVSRAEHSRESQTRSRSAMAPSACTTPCLLALVFALALVPKGSSWITNMPSSISTRRLTSTFRDHDRAASFFTRPSSITTAVAMRASSADTHSPTTSLTRTDWLHVAAAITPVVFLGTQQASAAGGDGTVTVLGAGGKTGRECVEYLAACGKGDER